ncbi:MAG: hypothetical protein WC162_05105 [Sphaerochaetaceae bacterium]|nr:hypothetical protein [Sphaerochaetaceae bacterium]
MKEVSFQKIYPNKALRYIIINSNDAKKFIDGMTKIAGYSFNTLTKYFSRNNFQFNPNINSLQKVCDYSEIKLLDFLFLSQSNNCSNDFYFKNPKNFLPFCTSSIQLESLKLYFNDNSFSIDLEQIIYFLSKSRKKKNLSEQEIANLLNVKKQRISQIENCYKIENSYKLKTIVSYSNAIGFPIEAAIINTLTLKRLHLHN